MTFRKSFFFQKFVKYFDVMRNGLSIPWLERGPIRGILFQSPDVQLHRRLVEKITETQQMSMMSSNSTNLSTIPQNRSMENVTAWDRQLEPNDLGKHGVVDGRGERRDANLGDTLLLSRFRCVDVAIRCGSSCGADPSQERPRNAHGRNRWETNLRHVWPIGRLLLGVVGRIDLAGSAGGNRTRMGLRVQSRVGGRRRHSAVRRRKRIVFDCLGSI